MATRQAPKLHAACDICRKRKLKCTGEHPKCSRCERKGLVCVYAAQKPMGRPKKRQREVSSEDGEDSATQGENDTQPPNSQPTDVNGTTQVSEEDSNAHCEGRFFGSSMVPNLPPSPWPLLDGQGPALDHPSSVTYTSETSMDPNSTQTENTPATSLSDHHHHHHVGTWQMGPSDSWPTTNLPTGCACLSAMYLEMSSLQSMTFEFPSSLHQIRRAISTAWGVLNCKECPRSFFTGFQNVQLLGLFMVCTAERYVRILGAVDNQAEQAREAKAKLGFAIGDLQGSNTHLHTNDPEVCLAGMKLDLDPLQWKKLVKRVIQGEVKGTPVDCCPSFLDLLNAMIARNKEWHRRPPPLDYPRPFSAEEMAHRHNGGELENCIKVVVEAKNIVDHMDFT